MFRKQGSKTGALEDGGELEARVRGVEAQVEALVSQQSALASLDQRVQILEAAASTLRQVTIESCGEKCGEFSQEILGRVEEVEESCKAEVSSKFHKLSEALEGLVQECTICASKSSVEGLQEELAELRSKLSQGGTQQALNDRLSDQGAQLERLRNALSGDGQQLREFMEEETLRKNNLRVHGATAEWLVNDIETWIGTLARGESLESPPFTVEAPEIGRLDSLRLRFFPNGGPNVSSHGTCSLYLEHPAGMPWAQYELMVGQSRRGTFDPIFTGNDDFCILSPELYPLGDVKVVRLCVRFLPLSRLPAAPVNEATAVFPMSRLAEAPSEEALALTAPDVPADQDAELTVLASRYTEPPKASWGEAPHQTRLWLASNRANA